MPDACLVEAIRHVLAGSGVSGEGSQGLGRAYAS